MPDLVPVDHDPFAVQMPPPGYTPSEIAASQSPGLVPVDHDPFAPGHAVSGPTDSLLTDIPRRIGSAALNAGVGLVSPLLGLKNAVGIDTSGHVTQGPTPQPQEAKDNAYNAVGATEYKPSTEAGRVTQAGLEGAASSLLGGGMLPMAAGGALAQTLVDKTPLPPLAAALVGQVAGAHGTNLAMSKAGPLLPGAIDPETRSLAQTAVNDYGITVPMAKVSNSPFVRYLDSTVRRMPFSGYGAADEANQTAFNRGLAGTFGENADKITPEVLNRGYDRIGGVFNDVAARTTVKADPQFVNDLAAVETNAPMTLTESEMGPIRKQIDNVLGKIQPGDTISGDAYQSLTRKGTPLDAALSSGNPNIKQYAGQIRTALDDALQRSAAPEDVAALQQARTQYKALKTVEPLTMRADTIGGSTPTTGDISPAGVLSRVNQQYTNAARAPLGDIPLKDLAQIGQRFLKEPGSSGTAERGNIMHLIEQGGAALGGVLGAEHFGGVSPLYTVPPLAAAIMGPRAIGSVLRSPATVNRAVNGPTLSPLAEALSAQLRLNGPAGGQ